MQRMRVPTYPVLRSFWIALTLLFGVSAILGLWALEYHEAALWSLLVVTVVSAIGLSWPGLVLRPYDAWNRLARVARRAARLWLTGVVFLSIGVVGLFGSRMQRRPPTSASSGWVPIKPRSGGSNAAKSDIPYSAGAPGGWVRRYAVWAWRSGNLWSCSLLPALMLLKVAEGESRGSLGGDVYTLY